MIWVAVTSGVWRRPLEGREPGRQRVLPAPKPDSVHKSQGAPERHLEVRVDTSRPTFRCMTDGDTMLGMAQAISVRLDDEALRALGQLEAAGMTRSEAIRAALVEAAARRHDKQTLAAEVAALEADEEDRAEMLAVADLMEQLRAAG